MRPLRGNVYTQMFTKYNWVSHQYTYCYDMKKNDTVEPNHILMENKWFLIKYNKTFK